MNLSNATGNGTSFDNFDGDDFSNNLIQDLGPLLSLFGANVATQFLSQSLTWADNILFAIGPLGVITAVVSAIRVGAPQSLRSFIGRAREPRAEVEAELLSSTSKEVCEMWNGTALVRVRGTSSVAELLVAFTKDGSRPDQRDDLGLHVKESLDESVIELPDSMKSVGDEKRQKSLAAEKQPSDSHIDHNTFNNEEDIESQGYHGDDGGKTAEDASTRPFLSSPNVPNISLNYLPTPNSTELVAFSIISIILQLGVLCLDCLITYYWRWTKGGETVAHTACPFVVIGTLLLTVGMWACSAVIQWGTNETWYRIKDDANAKLIWLQRKSVVDDQHFGSYAIFASDTRRAVVSSTRERHFQDDNALSIVQDQRFTLSMVAFKTVTVLAVVTSVVGYVIQFIGFRQMHWLAALFQLALSIIMTAIRAYVRRGLSRQPLHQPLPVGHELDWLATRAALYKQLPPERRGDPVLGPTAANFYEEKPKSVFQRISPLRKEVKRRRRKTLFSSMGELVVWVNKRPNTWYGTDADRIDWLIAVPQLDTLAKSVNKTTAAVIKKFEEEDDLPEYQPDPQNILRVHCRLQELTQWDLSDDPEQVEVLSIVTSLVAAIEGVMSSLSSSLLFKMKDTKHSSFEWAVPVGAKTQLAMFHLRIENGKWIANMPELKAALSLWTYSLTMNPLEKDFLQAIFKGQDLVRDMSWWIPGNRFGVREGNESAILYEFLPGTRVSGEQITRVCAWHLLSIFTRSAMDSISVIQTETISEIRDFESAQSAPSQIHPKFRNPAIQSLVAAVSSSGLCSELEAYLAIVPPLSELSRLPHPDSLVDKVINLTRSLEKQESWSEAAQLYSSLIRTSLSFGPASKMALRAIAVAAEYLAILDEMVDVYEMRADEIQLSSIRASSQIVQDSIVHCGDAVRTMRSYYELQGQVRRSGTLALSASSAAYSRIRHSSVIDQYDLARSYPNRLFTAILTQKTKEAQDLLERSPEDARRMANETDILGWSPLHYYTSSRHFNEGEASLSRKNSLGKALLRAGADPNLRNILGMTSLHCAVRSQNREAIDLLIQFGADVNARDVTGKTALHVAARIMDESLVVALYEKGADVDCRDHLGLTPLHHAALMGNMDNVRLLMDAQANRRARDAAGMTPFLFICGQSRCDNSKVGEVLGDFLTREGSSLKARGQTGMTALHYAAKSGCLESIRYLRSASGPELRRQLGIETDQEGLTPFHWAAKKDNAEALEELYPSFTPWLDDIEEPLYPLGAFRDKLGRSILQTASACENLQVVDLVLRREWCSVNEKDDDDMTALHICCRNKEIAKRLVAAGARITAKDINGRMAIHYAREPELIDYHLAEHDKRGEERESPAYWQDRRLQTPLHVAVTSSYKFAALSTLVEGLPRLLDVKDADDGNTALHLLVERTDVVSLDAIVLLLGKGASTGVKNRSNLTPLELAIRQCNENVVNLFLGKGVRLDPIESLRHVALVGHVGIAKMLLDKVGVDDINCQVQQDGMTPLHVAVQEGYMDLADLFVERGADYFAQNGDGQAPWELIITEETRRATLKNWEAMRAKV